jgi:hypothetical protein
MAIEYDFFNNFPSILLDSIANAMQYLATNPEEYMQLFLVVFVASIFLGAVYFLLNGSFGSLKAQYNKIVRELLG